MMKTSLGQSRIQPWNPYFGQSQLGKQRRTSNHGPTSSVRKKRSRTHRLWEIPKHRRKRIFLMISLDVRHVRKLYMSGYGTVIDISTIVRGEGCTLRSKLMDQMCSSCFDLRPPLACTSRFGRTSIPTCSPYTKRLHTSKGFFFPTPLARQDLEEETQRTRTDLASSRHAGAETRSPCSSRDRKGRIHHRATSTIRLCRPRSERSGSLRTGRS